MKKEVVVTIVRQPLKQCAAFVVATQLSRKESVALANCYFEHIPMTVETPGTFIIHIASSVPTLAEDLVATLIITTKPSCDQCSF
ncbi:MAG TPA: hypothetical protein VEI73_16175 [Candidatus Acidoferrum sp.]|nr:hypothetical protein [Candidatus Acidoferrum sp.]